MLFRAQDNTSGECGALDMNALSGKIFIMAIYEGYFFPENASSAIIRNVLEPT